MNRKAENNTGGLSFVTLLAILFIGLKLAGAIDWSWWWVLAPLWGPVVLILIIVILLVIAKVAS